MTITLVLDGHALDDLVERVVAEVLARLRQDDGRAESPWMTVEEAAAWLHWPRKRLYKLTAARAVPHRKHDGRILLHRDELRQWLDEHREG